MANHRRIYKMRLVLGIIFIGWGFSTLHVSPAEALSGAEAGLPQPVLDKTLYLPQLSKDPPFMLRNGDFESGPIVWSEYSLRGWPLISNTSELPPALVPHSGSWAAWLGGDDNEDAVLSQTVTVMPGTAYLVFWHFPVSEEYYCWYDLAEVLVNGIRVWSLGLCDSTSPYYWSVESIYLDGFIGNKVTLSFHILTDGSLYSSWFIDDVSLQASPGVMPDALPAEAPAERSVPRR